MLYPLNNSYLQKYDTLIQILLKSIIFFYVTNFNRLKAAIYLDESSY